MKGLRKIKHQQNVNHATHPQSWISSSMFSKNRKYFEKLSDTCCISYMSPLGAF